jgi:hypothetical protein
MAKRNAAQDNKRAPKTASGVPKHWPAGISYLTKPVYSKALSNSDIGVLNLKTASAEVRSSTDGPCPLVQITSITAQDHPANGQFGLFATQHLLAGSLVLFYLGFVHSEVEADVTSDYDLSLDRELGVGVDATNMGNEARFINDYRGVNPSGPNAEFKEVWVDVGRGCVEKRMAVFVLPAGKSGKRAKGIGKGEEILVSYGKGFWKERNEDNHDVEDLQGNPPNDVG